MAKKLAEVGIDFSKDDELRADGSHGPFEDQVRAVMRAINGHAECPGKKLMFAFNLTGGFDQMRQRHDMIFEFGGTRTMVSPNSIGSSGMIAIGRHTQLLIHAHRNGWGYLSRHLEFGWSYIAWQRFWRIAGADHMHVNGLSNKFCEDDERVIASAKECLTPMFANKPCIAMPVFSSSQSAIQRPETYRRLGSADLIYAAGGGIMAIQMARQQASSAYAKFRTR